MSALFFYMYYDDSDVHTYLQLWPPSVDIDAHHRSNPLLEATYFVFEEEKSRKVLHAKQPTWLGFGEDACLLPATFYIIGAFSSGIMECLAKWARWTCMMWAWWIDVGGAQGLNVKTSHVITFCVYNVKYILYEPHVMEKDGFFFYHKDLIIFCINVMTQRFPLENNR